MNIKDLYYLQQVITCNSIRKAANALYITPQGLSKSIRNLETELGYKLLERTPYGVEATPHGLIVLKHAEPILNRMKNMEDELDNVHEILDGRINIACAYGITSALELPYLMEFKKTHPNIEININEEPDLIVEELVRSEKVQLGFTIGPVNDDEFKSQLIRHHKLKLLVNTKNGLSNKRSVCFKELNKEAFILVNEKFKTHHTILQNCKAAGFQPNIVTDIAEISMAHKYCHQNLGIGVTVDYVLDDIKFDNVIPIDFDNDNCNWDIYIISRREEQPSPAEQLFIDYVTNWFGDK
ncbi:MAG: LysR family transcriptional regulator [Lachnospiraceae bacterium]